MDAEVSSLPSEEKRKEGSRQIQSLISVVISVVKISPAHGCLEEPVNHVPERWEEIDHVSDCHMICLEKYSPEEIGFLGLTEAADSDVRQELLLEDVFGVLYPLLPRHPGLGTSHTNEIQSYVLLLNDEGFIQ